MVILRRVDGVKICSRYESERPDHRALSRSRGLSKVVRCTSLSMEHNHANITFTYSVPKLCVPRDPQSQRPFDLASLRPSIPCDIWGWLSVTG